jgi:ketosteroid isomerase-like protein
MRGRTLGLLVFALLCFAPAAQPADPKISGPREGDQAWKKGMEAGDVDAIMKLYGSDAVLWMPDAPVARGEKAIRESYAGLLGANTVKDVEFFDDHEELSGNVGGHWGRFKMTLVPKSGGAPVTMVGRFTEVWKRKQGRWVLAADHASADPAPAKK